MSVSKNSVVKSVLCPAMDWADLECSLPALQILMADVQDIFTFSWPGCSDVFFDARFPRGAVSIVCFCLLHQFSLTFLIVNRWLLLCVILYTQY